MKAFRPNFFFIFNDINHNKNLLPFYYIPPLSVHLHQSKSCQDSILIFQPTCHTPTVHFYDYNLSNFFLCFLNVVPYYYYFFGTMFPYLFFFSFF